MDFGQLLSVAQKNNSSKQSGSYYSTKFTPPKKETKQSKALSNNIKKFLARKEEEEKKKALEEKRKRENLLSMRDHKAQSRINKHLKVCKAANKAVIADAINTEDTAVTITGPSQPDEDDYGYVSQEASAFYDRLMNKYNSTPEKPLFSDSGKRVVKDIASTKDRVKQALKQQEIDDSLPHRRKRKSADAAATPGSAKDYENEKESQREKDKDKDNANDRVKKKRPPMPPPLDFVSLLKLAEKKQHEPVVIESKPKPKTEIAEFERPMTKKQKKEFMKEKEWRDKKEREKNNASNSSSNNNNNNSHIDSNASNGNSSNDVTSKSNKPLVNKYNSKLYNELTSVKPTMNKSSDNKNLSSKLTHSPNPSTKIKNDNNNKVPSNKVHSKPVLTSEKDEILEERRKLEMEKRKLESMRRMIEEEKRKLALESKNKKSSQEAKISSIDKIGKSNDKVESSSSNLKDVKTKQSSSANNVNKSRVSSGDPVRPVKQFPPADCYNNKPKQFPPPDMMRRKPMKPSMNGRRPMTVNKRRIYDDDEDEYDSELDDFIDDDPQGESEDYSKYISEIFGYDKSKYRNFDDDDINMESNYAQQLKEEFVSTKIGIMEDLEDIRQEALEKKRKAVIAKKTKRKL